MSVRIQLRRDTAANWASTNPTLTQGEPGYETDTGKIKYGDGTTAWNSLAYSAGGAFAAGSASSPSITFSGDTNTGIYSPGADQLALATNGTGRLFVDSSGKVGIATSTPQDVLHLNGASGTVGLRLQSGANITQIAQAGADLYFNNIAAGSSIFYTNNTERLRITSAGLVGVGTSSPNLNTSGTCIHVSNSSAGNAAITRYTTGDGGTAATDGLDVGMWSDGDAFFWLRESSNIRFATASTERVRIDSSGRVGIGTTSPDSGLVLTVGATNGYPVMGFQNSGTTYGDIGWQTGLGMILGARSTTPLLFYTNGSERARIDSSGRLLVGTSTSLGANALLQVYKSSGNLASIVDSDSLSDDQSSTYTVRGGTASGDFGVVKHSGIASPCVYLDLQAQDGASNYYWTDNSDILRTSTSYTNIGTTGGTVVGAQTSDERIKNILGPVEYGLDALKQINPVRYTLKSEPETEKLGFIAQQVQPLVPQSVFDTGEHIDGEPDDAPTKLGMEYVALIPVLVNAIKELSGEVDSLKAQLS